MFRSVILASCITVVALSTPPALVAVAAGPIPEAPDAIAYTSEGDVLVLDVATGKSHVVTSDVGFERWSPRGRSIAFISDRDGAVALYVLGTNGVVKVAPAASLDWSWSPDGRSIAWVSRATWADLWVTDVATGVSTNLTGGTREVWDPTWAPDSTLIAFASTNEEGWKDIFTMPRGGGPAVNLTGGSTGNDFDPVWSVDGTAIAFSSQRDGASAIYLVGADGTNPMKLIDAPAVESCGNVSVTPSSWSPDGSHLGYSARVGCGSPIFHQVRFYVLDMASGTSSYLASGNSSGAAGPTWSPDGNKVSMVIGAPASGPQDILVVGPNGSDLVSVSDMFGLGACVRSPSWTPDSTRIAFVRPAKCGILADPPPTDVYVVDLEAGGPPTLIGPGSAPSWRPQAVSVGLVDPATGVWHLPGVPPFYYGNPGDIPFMGDWDCDGVDTPGLFRTSDAYAYLRNSNTQGVADIRFFSGNPDDVPLAGDFNGDGCDTLSLYRPSEQRFYIVNRLGKNEGGLGAADFFFTFGNPGDMPIVGDWDGDGIDEVGLHRESTGLFYWHYTLDTGIASGRFIFGDPGDRFVAGDWGIVDSADTPAVFRPSNTTMFFRHTLTEGVADFQFVIGESPWLPISGTFGL